MHVFIPVFFNAPLGGLQSHVLAQVCALLRAGHQCMVMCKPGPFSASLRALGVRVLESDFSDVDDAAAAACADRYDLVHAHPFLSRAVGMEVARRQAVPLIVTFHGTYTDSIDTYQSEVDIVIAVSAAIRDFLLSADACPASRILVLPNGVDTDVFTAAEADFDMLRRSVPALAEFRPRTSDRHVLFVSRLDPDKAFILDVVKDAWDCVRRTQAYDLTWWVAGDGVLRQEMEQAAQELNESAGRRLVTFVGWQDEPNLALLYNNCHLAIAPGRSALESMACARPVIAIDSKGYVGLIDSTNAAEGIYGNFGGLGRKHEEYEAGTMFRDIERVVYHDRELEQLGRLSGAMVDAFYRQVDLDQTLLRVYEMAGNMRPRSHRTEEYVSVQRPSLAFADAGNPTLLSASWTCPPAASNAVTVVADGTLRVEFSLAEDEKIYLYTGDGGFDRPPSQTALWTIEPGRDHIFALRFATLAGAPRFLLWYIEYDGSHRLGHSTLPLRNGDNHLTVKPSPTATCFRLALRCAGSGSAQLHPIQHLVRADTAEASDPPLKCLDRAGEIAPFEDYGGENLVFIMGPPRSGTTWVLNLLRNHPDVIAANIDNLACRVNESKTLETNIFNADRPFTDMQIRRRFYLLSAQHPGKIAIEKTPIHLLYVDRIRRLFPNAALVLLERDGRDVVTSLVHVGRDREAWWQGAPETVEKATAVWRRYAEAAERCKATQRPYVLRYEKLLSDTSDELTRLLLSLGLSTHAIEHQVDQSREGKGIPIPGVYREGKTQGWRSLFAEQDVHTFKELAGDLLVALGYERNGDWGLSD